MKSIKSAILNHTRDHKPVPHSGSLSGGHPSYGAPHVPHGSGAYSQPQQPLAATHGPSSGLFSAAPNYGAPAPGYQSPTHAGNPFHSGSLPHAPHSPHSPHAPHLPHSTHSPHHDHRFGSPHHASGHHDSAGHPHSPHRRHGSPHQPLGGVGDLGASPYKAGRRPGGAAVYAPATLGSPVIGLHCNYYADEPRVNPAMPAPHPSDSYRRTPGYPGAAAGPLAAFGSGVPPAGPLDSGYAAVPGSPLGGPTSVADSASLMRAVTPHRRYWTDDTNVAVAIPHGPIYPDLEDRLRVALGRHDWGQGVELALRRALQDEAPGARFLAPAALAALLKREFGVGASLTNPELLTVLGTFPRGPGGVDVEAFVNHLMGRSGYGPSVPGYGNPSAGLPLPAMAPMDPSNLPPAAFDPSGFGGVAPPVTPRRGVAGLDPVVAKIDRAFRAETRDPGHLQTLMQRLQRALETNDASRSGEVSYREFVGAFKTFNPPLYVTDEELQALFRAYDTDNVGYVPLDLLWGDLQYALARHGQPEQVDVPMVRARVQQQLRAYDRHGSTAAGLGRALHRYDTDGDGRLTRTQLHRALQECNVSGLSVREFDALFEPLDHHGTGTVSIAEFIEGFYREMHGTLPPPDVLHARVAGNLPRSKYPILAQRLKAADSDQDGMVTKYQFIRVLKSCDARANNHELGAVFDHLDPNHTGKVAVKDFLGSVYCG